GNSWNLSSGGDPVSGTSSGFFGGNIDVIGGVPCVVDGRVGGCAGGAKRRWDLA
ncbi:hypothetical protein T484DRAFT_1945594, partial [Baffinella frigidus]